jgi:hypothetical protein
MLLALGGCGLDTFYSTLPPTLNEIDAVAADDSLSPQEKRQRLEELGLTPLVINAVLSGERTANQFGGDLRSAYDKVVGGQFDQLTPDEIQLYNDAARNASSTITFTLSDAEAQAIRDLFVNNDIRTEDDLSAFLADPGNEVPAPIPDGSLQQLFVDLDPALVRDELP